MQDSMEERVHGAITGKECKAALRTLYQRFVDRRSEAQREEMKDKSDMRYKKTRAGPAVCTFVLICTCIQLYTVYHFQ